MFINTEEQNNIEQFIEVDSRNLLIEARAGTGKTYTIVKAVRLLPQDKSITFLAFNKHIQMELKEKLPPTVYCYTSHGLGRGGITRKYKDAELDEFKMDKIITNKAHKWDLSDFQYDDELEQYLKAIKRITSLCKSTLTTQKKKIPELAEKYDIPIYSNVDVNRVLSILEASVNDKKTYDFDDMIFLPAIDPKIWLFPQDYVLVDEAQDMNRAQQEIIRKILKKDKKTGKVTGRLISVGDEKQAIYGFSGSDVNSFNWFRKQPNTVTLPLTTTFRCSKEVVLQANKIVPDLNAMPTAKRGCVKNGNVLLEAKSGDFVLCRKTLPLVKLFFQFLSEHRKATIKGSDIGSSLIDMVNRKRDINILKSNLKNNLRELGKNLKDSGILNIKEHSGYTALEDKTMVLLFIAEMSKNMFELKRKIRSIFTDKIEGIVLSTVHKIKGLEADRVFIIRPDILPMKTSKPWEYQQEKNLEYVAITRARDTLIYDYEWNDEKISLSDIKKDLL